MVESVLTASRALVAVAARSLTAAPLDVTLPQYRVLVVLESRGPQSVSALAADLGTAPSSLTRMCDRLVRKGLVERSHSPGDRRQVLISVAPAGAEVVNAVTAVRRKEIARLLAAIPERKRRLVADALVELAVAGGEQPGEMSPLGWAP